MENRHIPSTNSETETGTGGAEGPKTGLINDLDAVLIEQFHLHLKRKCIHVSL